MQFSSVLFGMLSSTIPVSIIGSKFAMSNQPFWSPMQYGPYFATSPLSVLFAEDRLPRLVPIVGMLCGSTISGIIVSVSYVLKELKWVLFHRCPHPFVLIPWHCLAFSENRDKVEMYLAFGASRFEACKPIATEALRLALTPTINQMRYVHEREL
jgi:hypothetical protein